MRVLRSSGLFLVLAACSWLAQASGLERLEAFVKNVRTGRAKRPPFEDNPHQVADELQRLVDAGAQRFRLPPALLSHAAWFELAANAGQDGRLTADQIVVLDNGQVVGAGTHSELLESCAVYREFADSQAVVAGGVA